MIKYQDRIEKELIQKYIPHHYISIFRVGDKVKVKQEFKNDKTFKNDIFYIIDDIKYDLIKLKGNIHYYSDNHFYKESKNEN